MLLSENIDVSSAVEMIDKTRQAMVEMRSGKVFQQALVDARELCNRIETEAKTWRRWFPTSPRNISYVNSTTRRSDQLLEILTYFNINRAAANFRNFPAALNIFLTLLVTAAAGENVFPNRNISKRICHPPCPKSD
ncbi:hypothetical protein AVEN_21465-1 [Araneus ventricosus]|uniref:Uncharacterized protein n=1 Tax=Araneus ventricosus TaxID=182803 RepID=A0A4Y2QL76_ARAVE|nr:hypothetical protein AVEN_176151-1 [Araneus ventricosus]GBN64081.1 hypothetical protein AVEN_21465-1 [Araneus ventricosus]